MYPSGFGLLLLLLLINGRSDDGPIVLYCDAGSVIGFCCIFGCIDGMAAWFVTEGGLFGCVDVCGTDIGFICFCGKDGFGEVFGSGVVFIGCFVEEDVDVLYDDVVAAILFRF